MEFWSNIINTAMLGTDKKTVGVQELPADLAEAAAVVNANAATDKEEKFLQLASLAFSYRQCGVEPVQKETVSIVSCPEEERPYCNAEAQQALKNILGEENIPLLKIWLQRCAEKKQIVHPGLLPTLLTLALQHKQLQPLIAECGGKRGEWIAHFNQIWNFSTNQTIEQRWQMGSPEQRRAALKEMRVADPALARDWLQQTWAQEDANTKVSLLEQLYDTVNANDITFLETLSKEKSKKVQEEALKLLKHIPASPIIKQYEEVLKQCVSLRKEKALLGLSSKTFLHFQLPSIIDESIFKTGIEKLSSNTKEYSDDEFIIYQLIRFVPPAFWEKNLNDSFENIVRLFYKDDMGKKMVRGLVLSIVHFKDVEHALKLIGASETFYVNFLPLLSQEQQDHFSLQFFDDRPDGVIRHAIGWDREWTVEFTHKFFGYVVATPYDHNKYEFFSKTFYEKHIHLIPAEFIKVLDRFMPSEESMKNLWTVTIDKISKLLTLKSQTINAFKA